MYVLKVFGVEGWGVVKRDKITIGCLIPTFWRAHKWPKCYVTPTFSMIPKKGDEIKTERKKQKRRLSRDVYDSALGNAGYSQWSLNP